MRLKKFLKNEKGFIVVFLALSITFILGFAALVVDYGQLTNNRRLLQNAADAAALAAALELPADSSEAINDARNAAIEYAARNGVTNASSNVSVSHPSTSEVKVDIQQEVPLSFGGVLIGSNHKLMTASATAEKTSSSGSDFEYTLLSGSSSGTGITIYYGTGSKVVGDLHSNSNVSIQATTMVGQATAVGTNVMSYESFPLTAHAASVTMPDFDAFLASKDVVTLTHSEILSFAPSPWDIGYYMSGGKYVYGFWVEGIIDDILAAYPDKFVRIDGALELTNGSGHLPYGNLIVSGNVIFDGNYTGEGDPYPPDETCIISETGNITFNNAVGKVAGLFYAPKGVVTIHGTNTNMYGKIIANSIVCSNGIKIDGSYDIGSILGGGETKTYLVD
ncbi:MAG: pilus assembly protein TadG-related protein [Lachnospiraceae bacterium]|nr:pilus assembly protein TadG-related protein [Lachnospiraceae bacterium]